MQKPYIDEDWVDLLLEAKAIGLTIEEVKYFLLKKDKELQKETNSLLKQSD